MAELVARGVTERKARQLALDIADDQPVPDQIGGRLSVAHNTCGRPFENVLRSPGVRYVVGGNANRFNSGRYRDCQAEFSSCGSENGPTPTWWSIAMVQPMAATVQSVLLISPYPEDRELMKELLSVLPCTLEFASSWGIAVTAVRHGSFGVVVCEQHLPDSSWEEVLSHLDALVDTPLFVVISRLADERLWAAVLNHGGFDVLAKPLVRAEVIRVLGHALEQCEQLQWQRKIRGMKYVRSTSGC